jgi:putative transposase
MPRKNRGGRVIPFVPHHVTHRGNNKRTLFSQPPDYHRFIALIADAKVKTHVEVHCVVLMTNHLHFVVTPRSTRALSKFMGSIAQRWSQLRNAQKMSSGKLWEGPFHSEPLLTEAHLAATLAYIELNPVRAGLVDDASQYRWSSFACHAGGEGRFPARLWTPTDWYQSLGATIEERQRRYAEYVRAAQARGGRPSQFETLDAKEERLRLTQGIRVRRPSGLRKRLTKLPKNRIESEG